MRNLLYLIKIIYKSSWTFMNQHLVFLGSFGFIWVGLAWLAVRLWLNLRIFLSQPQPQFFSKIDQKTNNVRKKENQKLYKNLVPGGPDLDAQNLKILDATVKTSSPFPGFEFLLSRIPWIFRSFKSFSIILLKTFKSGFTKSILMVILTKAIKEK